MTGSAADPLAYQPHIRTKARREALANRFKDPADPLRLVIVRDMWLTGFDAPCMHTMYLDKPMRGHGLMQAIARVNRVFRDKPGGLVVDYLGLADQLKHALHTYTQSGGHGETAVDQQEAVALMLERHEQCCDLFRGFDWSAWTTGSPGARLSLLPAAQQHTLAQERGKDRLLQTVTELSPPSPWRCRTTRRSASATTAASSRRCAARSPRRRARGGPLASSTRRSASSSPRPSRPRR
jgi:type I restriction enzyme R subunit